jgi:hypothetical protein
LWLSGLLIGTLLVESCPVARLALARRGIGLWLRSAFPRLIRNCLRALFSPRGGSFLDYALRQRLFSYHLANRFWRQFGSRNSLNRLHIGSGVDYDSLPSAVKCAGFAPDAGYDASPLNDGRVVHDQRVRPNWPVKMLDIYKTV